jgi:thymidylate kinase
LTLALPSYHTAFGSLIASYLGKENPTVTIAGDLSKDIAWVLWSLDRAQHNPEVAKWLEGNPRNIVLSKRWTDSNIAYQGPLGISEKRILQFERNLVKADYTIVLDVPLDLVFRRMEVSGEIPDKYETPEFLSKVSNIYKNLEQLYPIGKILHIDGSGSFEEVNATLIKTMSSMRFSVSLQAVSERFC